MNVGYVYARAEESEKKVLLQLEGVQKKKKEELRHDCVCSYCQYWKIKSKLHSVLPL